MAREDDYYGNEYLTGAQQLEEDYRLAPGGATDVGNRLRADVAQTAAANDLEKNAAALANPLLAPRDSGLGTAGQVATTPVTAAQSNPMIRPPVDFNMMPVEKQIKWRALAVQQQTDRDAAEKQALDIAVSKSKNDFRLEQVRQGNEFMKELPRLQALLATGKTNDYENLKSELVSKHPLAMGAEEVQNAIKPFDEHHTKLVGFEEGRNKTKAAIEEKVLQKRIDDGFEMVKPLGPEASQRYAAMVATDPAKAIQYATDIAAPAQRENIIQSLKDQGFSDAEIAKYGTGPEFKYQAAGEAAKSRAALTQEKYKVNQDLTGLLKLRAEARFKPDKQNYTGNWTPELEQRYQATAERLNSLTPSLTRDPRAGVAGMSTEYYPYQREQQAAVAKTLPVTTPTVAARPPVQPTVPARPVTSPQRVPITQQRIQPTPTPVPTTPTAAPKPTPAPPPLNPAYPEHWVGGKRYIQMPDGKLYLSKVQ